MSLQAVGLLVYINTWSRNSFLVVYCGQVVQFRAEFDLVLYVLVLDNSNHDKWEWANGVAASSNFR